MKILALLAQKGGAGKTTIAVHLAVHHQQQGGSVLLVDVDPQGSTVNWWRSRQADTPLMVETTAANLPKVIAAAKSDKVGQVIIDTPPYSSIEAARAAELADLVVVPTRPAPFRDSSPNNSASRSLTSNDLTGAVTPRSATVARSSRSLGCAEPTHTTADASGPGFSTKRCLRTCDRSPLQPHQPVRAV